MRCRQPCRPADWAGLGKATLVLFRARNTLEELCPGGAGAGKGGGRASPSSSAPDSGAFTPSSLAFTISCNTSGSLIYIWKDDNISQVPLWPPHLWRKASTATVRGDETRKRSALPQQKMNVSEKKVRRVR